MGHLKNVYLLLLLALACVFLQKTTGSSEWLLLEHAMATAEFC